ncbi:DNA-binding transcriptional regulator, MerR family [Lachnospiraceae bacterium C7]|nr:DNA-binding transcriptional regulator, MerR family [Lachnospiraceae bacterium C7]
MDKNKLFPIGEVAKMFNISVGTIRHYVALGMLTPEYVDPDSGYRYFSYRQFEVITTIRYLRRLNMSLEEISDFLKNRDVDKILALLEAQKETIYEKRHELDLLEEKITYQINLIKDAQTSTTNTVEIRTIPRQHVAWLKSNISPKKYYDLEPSIRQFQINETDPIVYMGKIGVGITKDHLLENKFDSYDLVFLTIAPGDTYHGNTDIWEKCTCACLRFHGTHVDAAPWYDKLVNYIKKNGYTIDGFAREITLIDDGITNDSKNFITEIQIPIK